MPSMRGGLLSINRLDVLAADAFMHQEGLKEVGLAFIVPGGSDWRRVPMPGLRLRG